MADKEATVYIVDFGSSMAECRNGRTESNLDWSMRYVWDRISTTVAASRKTWNVGVIGFRTDDTSNPMEKEDGYEHISILQKVGPMDMSQLKSLQKSIKTSDTSSGDCISAIVLAVDMIETFTKKLKFKRQIVLVTDGRAPVDGDDTNEIADKIKKTGIQLTILGVDFDDAEFGFKEEDKPEQKAANEKLLRSLVEACDGQFGTVAEAIAELDTPRLKQTRPYKAYDGPLTLGNPEESEYAMSIHVERYFKTHKATVPPAGNVILRNDAPNGTQSTQTQEGGEMQGVEFTGNTFGAVKNARTYKVNDPDAPGGKRDVEFETLAKGYEYGSSVVHISESDFNITKINTTKSFSILGFIHQEKYEAFMNMGDTGVIVAAKSDDGAAMKLSSLIHSLHELESYAVARLVAKDGKDPVMLLLATHIDVDFECLYDTPLPFAEDVRVYEFPPLDKVITIDGKTLEKHRFLPSKDLVDTMSDYVDAMDISTFELDDTGERTQEYACVDDVYCPQLHRVNQVVRHRAIYPNEPVPPVPPILMKYSQPPQDLLEKAKSKLEDLIVVAELKQVPEKAQGRRQKKQKERAITGLDVDALLRQPESKRGKIDPGNSIPEFKQMVDIADTESVLEEAAKQMGAIIRQFITSSMGDKNYDRAIENMGAFREKMIDFEVPSHYNSFARDLKMRLLSGELGGDRRELWWQIKGAKLGLIDQKLSEVSKVTAEEASEFWSNKKSN